MAEQDWQKKYDDLKTDYAASMFAAGELCGSAHKKIADLEKEVEQLTEENEILQDQLYTATN